ncbi:uncharacterized protein Aud_008947 [Aspergillus udagawae]|uniref:Uncharacterized protein n=1 Tax=Aspergillus udagawae TaxID=91492 RepID=A0A8E0R0U4_9EURO|nr:uncharacterized protein Aud_008947 [Aspergillus udagawae]GIC92481.1 hypothetical protein Aud_008947 [Aspergillus udagawae]
MSSVDCKRRGLLAGACANCIWHSRGAQCEFYGGKSAHWDSEMDMTVLQQGGLRASSTSSNGAYRTVIVNKEGCFWMEAPKHDDRPRALRQKGKRAIEKKKAHKTKVCKMDSSIEILQTEVDRLEKTAAAEEAEVARKRTKAQELLKAIKAKEEEKEKKEKKDKKGKEGKEGKGKTGALVLRSKENEMNMEWTESD